MRINIFFIFIPEHEQDNAACDEGAHDERPLDKSGEEEPFVDLSRDNFAGKHDVFLFQYSNCYFLDTNCYLLFITYDLLLTESKEISH